MVVLAIPPLWRTVNVFTELRTRSIIGDARIRNVFTEQRTRSISDEPRTRNVVTDPRTLEV